MARNKYPEVTVEKILEVSKRLFLEKGYDNTTIQDIVDGLGGLTKGAIYHHFKSKDEIMNALGDKLFFENNPFDLVKGRDDLNGLQKMRELIMLNQSDDERSDISIQAIPILENPRILASAIESNLRILTPLWLELLEEGKRDGSIQTEYVREFAELLTLIDFWIMPSLFTSTAEEFYHKFDFIVEMFTKMGLPIFTDEMTATMKKHIAELTPQK